jgi:hypothetical protein
MARVSTNSHGCFVVTFPALHVYFISNMHILQSHETHFGTTWNSLL